MNLTTKGKIMKKNWIPSTVIFALLVVLLIFPARSQSQEPPEGVELVMISEYEVNTPVIEKVILFRFTLQPGASIENFKFEHTEL